MRYMWEKGHDDGGLGGCLWMNIMGFSVCCSFLGIFVLFFIEYFVSDSCIMLFDLVCVLLV